MILLQNVRILPNVGRAKSMSLLDYYIDFCLWMGFLKEISEKLFIYALILTTVSFSLLELPKVSIFS